MRAMPLGLRARGAEREVGRGLGLRGTARSSSLWRRAAGAAGHALALSGLLAGAVAVAGCGAGARRAEYEPAAASSSSLVLRARAGREPPTTERAWAAVQFAAAQVGKRYCWGGTGMDCFDCSGLVQRAWGAVGVRVPRTADAIADTLVEVRRGDVRAGDILWWPGHVGLYAGNGWAVEALDTRHGVVRRPAKEPERAFRPSPASWPSWPGEPRSPRAGW
jgi:cell wall-associated NlpC family hydrolase